MKKIISILCIITLTFTVEMQVYANPTAPIYNNDEKVVRVSNIDGKKWRSEWIDTKYNTDNITSYIGAEPYWRLGKNNYYYAIYKIEDNSSHYLIMTFSRNFYDLQNSWYVTKMPSKQLFKKYVDVGTPLEVVMLIDPDTYNINAESEKDLYYSYHRFADGTGLLIKYQRNVDEKWVVETSRYETDRNRIVKNLIDMDYQLIKNDNPNEEKEFLEKLKKLEEETTSNDPTGNTKFAEKKPAKIKIKSVKRTKRNKILVKFKKVKNAKKYQIQYAANKKFKKAKIKITKKNSYVIKKVSKKRTYYIRVRGVNGTRKGIWSKVKKVKKLG